MDALLTRCCGIDLHKDSIVACLLTGEAEETPTAQLRKFGAMYDDLLSLAAWLSTEGCAHVAMESTGAFWMPLYNRLTDLGVTCTVVNARKIKHVPGRKTDWNDAQWIAHLFRHGLLEPSYVPSRPLQTLRLHTRTLETLTEDRSREKNRIEKLLQTEGFKLSTVLEDVFCVTGRRLLTTLASKGRLVFRDVENARDPNCKSSSKEIAAAMRAELAPATGRLLAFKLRQLEAYDLQIAELQALIDDLVRECGCAEAVAIIDSIPGAGRQSAIDIIAEIGTDMDVFHSPEQLASWAGLSPRNDKSAEKKSPLASCPETNTSNAPSTNAPGAASVLKTPAH